MFPSSFQTHSGSTACRTARRANTLLKKPCTRCRLQWRRKWAPSLGIRQYTTRGGSKETFENRCICVYTLRKVYEVYIWEVFERVWKVFEESQKSLRKYLRESWESFERVVKYLRESWERVLYFFKIRILGGLTGWYSVTMRPGDHAPPHELIHLHAPKFQAFLS